MADYAALIRPTGLRSFAPDGSRGMGPSVRRDDSVDLETARATTVSASAATRRVGKGAASLSTYTRSPWRRAHHLTGEYADRRWAAAALRRRLCPPYASVPTRLQCSQAA